VHADRLAGSEFGQGGKEWTPVDLGEEHRRPVDAAQNRVHRVAGGDDAGVSGHTVGNWSGAVPSL
jgi:hypothetical protein